MSLGFDWRHLGDLDSLTRDETHTYCIGRRCLNHWMAGEVRCALFLIHLILKITEVVNMHTLFS